MPRLRNGYGVVVNVSDEMAANLGSAWTPVEDDKPEPKKAPAKRTTKKAATAADDE